MPTDLPPEKHASGDEGFHHRGENDVIIEKLGVGAAISTAGKVIGRGIDFGRQIVLARLLGVESFGLYSLIWSLLRIIGVLAPLGLQNGVIHFATPFYRKDGSRFKDVIVRSLGLSIGVSVGLSALLWLSAPWLANVFDEPGFIPAFRAFCLTIPPIVGLRVASGATRISKRMQYSIYAEELLQSVSALVFFLIFFVLGWQLLGAIWATTISFLLAFGLAFYYLYRLYPELVRLKRKLSVSSQTLLSYSLPTAAAGTSSVVVSRLDRLFLGFYHTAADVGIYQAASQFSIVSTVILDGFNAILSPIISDLYHRGQHNELEEMFRISTKWGLYVNIPVFLVIFFAPVSLIEVVFGAAYISGAKALLILTLGQVVNVAVGGVGRMLMMTGRQNLWLLSSGTMVMVSIVLNVILVPKFGMEGAAMAAAVSVTLLFGTGLFQVWHSLKLSPYDRRYRKGALATLVASSGLLLMRLIPQPDPLQHLFFTIVLACSLFYGTLLMLGLDKEDKTFFQNLRNRLVAKKQQ